MEGAWCEVAVEEIKGQSENALATGPFGSSISSKFFVDSGVPVIRGSNLSEEIGTRLKDEGLVFLSPEKAQEFRRSTVYEGDLIFTCWGTVNQVGLIDGRAAHREYVISNKQMKLTPDPEKANSLFLYYLFSGPGMQDRIKNQAIGSSVPGFNLGQLRAMRFRLPRLDEQRAIAYILGTLDDKIELNRRMNDTLKAMARALFKSWFVGFDPVRAKMDGRWRLGQSLPGLPAHFYDLFPDCLVPSELGEIPEGWEVVALSDVCARITDGSHSSPKSIEVGKPMASVKDMRDWGFNLKGCRHISEQDYQELAHNDCRPLARDVLIAKDGSYLKHIFVVEHDLELVILSSIAILRPNERIDPSLLAFTLQSDKAMARMEQYVSGAVLQRIVLKDFRQFSILVPPKHVQQSWARIAGQLLSRCWRNVDESGSLASLRDSLLPKLISGELRVRDAERIIGRAV